MVSPLKEILGACATWEREKDILLGGIKSMEWLDEATMDVLKYVVLKGGTRPNHNLKIILTSEH